LQDDLRFRKTSQVVSRRISDELILVPVSSSASQLSHIFRANPVGAFIFSRIEADQSVGQIPRNDGK
jgi:hypothetical protein